VKKTFIVVLFVALFVAIVGCSSKKYFEPQKVSSLHTKTESYSDEIIDLSRDGATLKSRRYIGKNGIGSVVLEEGYRFLSENEHYLLASSINGTLKVINKKDSKTLKTITFGIPVVSATIHNDKIAYILNNNTFGIYNIKENKKSIEKHSEHSFAIDTRAAVPLFVDTLVVMPMLDGKLIILSHLSPQTTPNVVYLSADKVFNNVIHLSRVGDTLVAATPQEAITFGDEGKKEYKANLSDIATLNQSIYLFTKEGEVIKTSLALKEEAKLKFKFAHFSLVRAFGDKVFALDQQGSLIVMNSLLTQYQVYALGKVEKPALIIGSKLYKDGKIIELSTLSYK